MPSSGSPRGPLLDAARWFRAPVAPSGNQVGGAGICHSAALLHQGMQRKRSLGSMLDRVREIDHTAQPRLDVPLRLLTTQGYGRFRLANQVVRELFGRLHRRILPYPGTCGGFRQGAGDHPIVRNSTTSFHPRSFSRLTVGRRPSTRTRTGREFTWFHEPRATTRE